MGTKLAFAVEHTAFSEGHGGGFVQHQTQRPQAPVGGPHEAGFHLDGGHAGPGRGAVPRGVAALHMAAARGMGHGHVEQGHQHAAVRHLPRVEVSLIEIDTQLGMAAVEVVQLEAEGFDEGYVEGETSSLK